MNRHSKSRRERKHKIKGSIRFGSCNEIFLRYEAPDDLVDKDEENVKNKFFDNAMKHLISKGVDSLPLLLNKYIPIPDNAVEVITIEEKNGNPKESRKDFLSLKKGKIIEEGVKRLFYNSLLKHFRYSDLTKSTIKNRLDEILNTSESSGYVKVFDKTLKTISPLVCGLGATHIFETSIKLHHIWGVPYIPGSSLKGVCRQVAFWKLVEERKLSKDDLEEFQKKFYGDLITDDKEILKYQLLFGTQGFKGLLLFLDAYPEIQDGSIKELFKLDIMNPHYSEYYGEKRDIPGDWENPVPVFFLTVKEEVSFRFVVLFDKSRWEVIKEKGIPAKEGKRRQLANEEIEGVEEYMKSEKFYEDIIGQALEFYGVGSKTRLGYGLFER